MAALSAFQHRHVHIRSLRGVNAVAVAKPACGTALARGPHVLAPAPAVLTHQGFTGLKTGQRAVCHAAMCQTDAPC
jgi:hypothetical protein